MSYFFYNTLEYACNSNGLTGYQNVPRTSTTCNIVYQLKILGPDSELGRSCSIFRYHNVSSWVFAKYASYTPSWHFSQPGVECSVISKCKIQPALLQLGAELLHGVCWYTYPLTTTLTFPHTRFVNYLV